MNTEFKKNRHSMYNLKFHLIVVTKYRHRCITEEMMDDLKNITEDFLLKKGGSVLEMNGEEDHVHVLFEIPPHVELASMVCSLKTVTSRLIRKKYSEYLKKFYWEPVFWSRSYCILSTGGATIDTIRKYIESQGKD